MSILHSDDLFQLIKSLKKSEKRYFKLNASRHVIGKANSYVTLFDAIEKQTRGNLPEYDEEKIIEEGKWTLHFSTLKNRLYEAILKSLDAYGAKSSEKAKAKKLLNYTEILYEKGLYRQCLLAVHKAKKIALKYNFHILILDTLNWETQLFREIFLPAESEPQAEDSYHELQEAISDFKKVNIHKQQALKLLSYWGKYGASRDKDGEARVRSLMSNWLFNVNESKLSFQAAYYYYVGYSTYFVLINEIERAYFYCNKMVYLLESKPHIINLSPTPYVNALNNLLNTQLRLKKYSEMEIAIKKLKFIKTNSQEIRSHSQNFALVFQLSLYATTGEFKRGMDIIKSNRIYLKGVGVGTEMRKKILDFNLAKIYFGNKEYSLAMKHLNKIIYSNAGPTIEMDSVARILNMIVCYEMGDNENLFESLSRSTYRFLHKRERLYLFETSIMNFIRKQMPKLQTQKQLITAFKELKLELERNSENNFEKNIFTYFDFISWLESKIEQRSFADIVKEKAKWKG
jgi:hypothetical protein